MMAKRNGKHNLMNSSIMIIWRIIENVVSTYYSLTYSATARNMAMEHIYPVYKSKLFRLDIMYGLFFTANN